jgi:dephospho-CoA kinase
MILVGLTGGIATGKSTVARMFGVRGAAVIDADQMVRELQKPGSAVYEAIVDAFGPRILGCDGTIDRKSLGDLVFHDEQLRRRLESIVHPVLINAVEQRVAELRTQGVAVCVVELPLLMEAEAERRFDYVVVVTAPEEVQIARLMADRGLTREDALARIASQIPLGEKERRGDFVIETTGALQQTERRVQEIYEWLLRNAVKKT